MTADIWQFYLQPAFSPAYSLPLQYQSALVSLALTAHHGDFYYWVLHDCRGGSGMDVLVKPLGQMFDVIGGGLHLRSNTPLPVQVSLYLCTIGKVKGEVMVLYKGVSALGFVDRCHCKVSPSCFHEYWWFPALFWLLLVHRAEICTVIIGLDKFMK